MKKAFTLFAAALLGFCAYADDVPCPSKLNLAVINADDPAQVEIELQLTNSSLNLNGFNMEIEKEAGSEAVKFKRVNWKWFTAEGYGTTILSRLDAPDDIKESMLTDFCDVQSNWKQNSDHLVIIEILKTLDCRFFPVLEEPAGIGKFWLDFSECEDGDYTLIAPATPTGCSFSYTGGVEGSRAWTTDEPITITINKTGDVITQKTDEPQPQPAEYSEFYAVGTFNGWSQEENMVELEANEAGTEFTGTVEFANDDETKEFKLITPVEDGWKWFGGVDDNQVGYFLITEELLNNPIDLIDGANFKVENPGKYTITVMNPAKGLQEPLVMTVSYDGGTGINTINSDNTGDNRIFDLQGRQLQSVPEHGIYIQNGKKYVK